MAVIMGVNIILYGVILTVVSSFEGFLKHGFGN